jgi:hypothetical protein
MAHDVFISHSAKDRTIATTVCEALEKAHIRCWIAPRDVQPGRSFAGEITRALQNCKALVLIFSAKANSSDQVLREVQLAVSNHLHIVQFRIEEVVPSDDFAYFLGTPHWLDALTPPLERHIQTLIASTQTLLGVAPEAPTVTEAREADMKAATSSTDLAPLLAEHVRALTTPSEQEREIPLHLWLSFPHAFVAGYGSVVEAKIENKGATSLQQVELMLESSGLVDNVHTSCRQVGQGNSVYFCLEVTPLKAGHFVLRCNVKGAQQDQNYAFRGAVPITVNAVPENASIALNLADFQSVRGAGGNTGQEFGAVKISNLVPAGTVRTLNDLLNVTFPQSFGRVPLELDYEVSRRDVARSRPAVSLSIPKKFLACTQVGTKLKLEPDDSTAHVPALHLVARDEFKLGRSRQDADFLTWFWPRSAENDDRTRRLSKVHVIAEQRGGKLILRDAGSANRATFEGHSLSETQNDVIDQRGTLNLSHEYQLDVTPFDSTLEGQLRIANERLWVGQPSQGPAARRGCVRFVPILSEVALYTALWLFTDATCGASKMNPLIIPELAEVEARFHYYRQNFWVEDLAGGSAVILDEHKLVPGEIAPLVNGARLRLRHTVFRVTVES